MIVTAMAVFLGVAPAAQARAPSVAQALRAADAPAAQLETEATPTLPGGTVVRRYSQEVDGIPVVGAGAVVVDPADGPAALLFDKTDPSIDAPGEPAISRATAEAAAANAIGLRRAWSAPSSRLVILEDTLAWEVSQAARRPLGDFVVTVDAASGEVLDRFNMIREATGSAQVFVPNPVVTNDGYTGLRDRKDKDYPALNNLREPVDLENINDGQNCLRGDWVNVKVGKKKKKVCKATLNWDGVTRASNKFEALMAYHHVDQAQTYIQSFGLLPINAESQNVIVDSFKDDNSFYLPSKDRIEMGTGGVDDGEDAEVFVHEYGHAVQDAQNPDAFRSNSVQAGAQGEGFGDYFAEAYATERTGFDDEWSHCVMEWDATSYDTLAPGSYPPGICLRRTDTLNTRSQQQDLCEDLGAPRNEIHCIGEVWSSALTDLRELIGDEAGSSVMDNVVLVSHQLLPPAPTFNDASEALIAADEFEYGAGDHCTEIRAEMVSRELLSASFGC
jgi:hypothetical protein